MTYVRENLANEGSTNSSFGGGGSGASSFGSSFKQKTRSQGAPPIARTETDKKTQTFDKMKPKKAKNLTWVRQTK